MKLKVRLTPVDVVKSLTLLFAGVIQGLVGIGSGSLVVNHVMFNALKFHQQMNHWMPYCTSPHHKFFFSQMIWSPSSIDYTTTQFFDPAYNPTCIPDATFYGHLWAMVLYHFLYFGCLAVTVAALSGSAKKTGIYCALALVPTMWCATYSAATLAFASLGACYSGGIPVNWAKISFHRDNKKLVVEGMNRQLGWGDIWREVGQKHENITVSHCWYLVDGINYVYWVGPWFLCWIAGFSLYGVEKKYKETLKFSLPFVIFFVGMALYGTLTPDWYTDVTTTDDDRVLMRVVGHPAAMEIMAIGFRSIGKNLSSVSLRIGYLFFPTKLLTLYSRLLVNSVSDKELLIVSSVCLGAVEIVMRTTVHQRDKMSQIVTSKLTGRKFTSFDRSFLMEYKCSLVVLEMVYELSDILSMAGFFIQILNPEGPLRFRWQQPDPFMRELGFNAEDYIVENCIIQVLIEMAVSLCCLTLEVSLGFPVLQVVRKGYFSSFFCTSTLFSFMFTTIFFMSLFIFPIKDLLTFVMSQGDGLDLTWQSQYHWTPVYNDLYDTWLYFIPAKVEVAYAKKWSDDYFA